MFDASHHFVVNHFHRIVFYCLTVYSERSEKDVKLTWKISNHYEKKGIIRNTETFFWQMTCCGIFRWRCVLPKMHKWSCDPACGPNSSLHQYTNRIWLWSEWWQMLQIWSYWCSEGICIYTFYKCIDFLVLHCIYYICYLWNTLFVTFLFSLLFNSKYPFNSGHFVQSV